MKPTGSGTMELLVASIVESILELVKAVKKLDARLKRVEKKASRAEADVLAWTFDKGTYEIRKRWCDLTGEKM